jgi:chromosome segregation ATPase
MNRRDERREQARQRERESRARRPFEERIARIEAELEALRGESGETEAWLASESAYEAASRERLQEALKRRAEIESRIATLEDDWLEVHARLEQAVQEARERRAD